MIIYHYLFFSGFKQHNTNSLAAFTSSNLPIGAWWGADMSKSGDFFASLEIEIIADANLSNVCLLSVSVGSIMSASCT